MDNDAKQASKRRFNEYTPSRILALAEKQGKAEPAEIIALRLGEVGIAGLPAEVFVEIGRDIQTHSLLSPTLAIGLTGGSMGYMPHRRGYHESGYESTYGSARYAEETPLKWAMEASRLLNDFVIHYRK
ncbi:hypothetical protein GF373_15375 [bacterium]|nr:hypothetical protein [bacterium]